MPTASDASAAAAAPKVVQRTAASYLSSAAAKDAVDREALYRQATESHPFVHRSHYHTVITSNAHITDAEGKTICIVMKGGLPAQAAKQAADVLRPAATRTSLRANIFGGESPFSGIAGYFDYAGSPIEHKCRKTSFTHEAANVWKGVCPMVDYINQLYKAHTPENWALQNAAIPDVIRVHNSVFSTLTINQRFRTAQHTDAGDFDEGFGMITCLDGDFDGLLLGFPRHGVAVRMNVGDVLLFNTHQFHANTELEREVAEWSRVTCVLYYRANLGANACMSEYRRRHAEALKAAAKDEKDRDEIEAVAAAAVEKFPNGITATKNGVNLNRPAAVHARGPSPLGMLLLSTDTSRVLQTAPETINGLALLHAILAGNTDPSKTRVRSVTWDVYDETGQRCGSPSSVEPDRADPAGVLQQAPECLRQWLHEALWMEPLVDTVALEAGTGVPGGASVFFDPAHVAGLRCAPQSSTAGVGTPAPDGAAPEPKIDDVPFWCAIQRAQEALRQHGLLKERRTGLRPRTEAELEPALKNAGSLLLNERVSSLGGFSESDTSMQRAAEHASFLSLDTLKAVVPEELFKMWSENRASWLALVSRDWKKMLARNPTREDFSWANKSDMNTAFFDLCDVASGVMLSILQKEQASPVEESRFWVAFATHLFHACQAELGMPASAMSMKKLNVKLKDHRFGGTRYFKDMDAEEQARRLARKERIRQARVAKTQLRGAAAGSDSDEESRTWLDIDHFDYQTEDCTVEYDTAKGLPDPVTHAASNVHEFTLHRGRMAVANSRHHPTAGSATAKSARTEATDSAAEPRGEEDRSGSQQPPVSSGPTTERLSLLVIDGASSSDDGSSEDRRAALVSSLGSLSPPAQAELWQRLLSDDAAWSPLPLTHPALASLAAVAVPAEPSGEQNDQAPAVSALREATAALAASLGHAVSGQQVAHDAAVVSATLTVDVFVREASNEQSSASSESPQKRADRPSAGESASSKSSGTVALSLQLFVARGIAAAKLLRGDGDVLPVGAPAEFDAVVLHDAFSSGMTPQDARRRALHATRLARGSPGIVLACQRDSSDASHFMLPPATRAATVAAGPVAAGLLRAASREAWWRGAQCAMPSAASWMSSASPVDFNLSDLERLLLLSAEEGVARGDRVGCTPSGGAGSSNRVHDFLGQYRIPRSPLNTMVCVLPPEPAAAV